MPHAYSAIAIADSDGRMVVQNVDALPSEYVHERFAAHRVSDGTRVVVGRPIQARGAHGWSIPVSRRFENPDGSFGGVIFAGLNASQFTDFYAHIFTGSAGAMMLVGQDGIVRARYVPTEGPTFGQDMRESTLATRLRQSPIGSYLSSRARHPRDHATLLQLSGGAETRSGRARGQRAIRRAERHRSPKGHELSRCVAGDALRGSGCGSADVAAQPAAPHDRRACGQ